jgi:hypothetical protein
MELGQESGSRAPFRIGRGVFQIETSVAQEGKDLFSSSSSLPEEHLLKLM